MNKFRLLTILVAGLLLSNLLLVVFILRAPGPPREGGPKREIIERLQLDKGQVADYERLISAHRARINALDDSIRMQKDALYRTLADTAGGVEPAAAIRELGRLQMEIETTHYHHFQDIRSLCRPDQQPRFRELTKDIGRLFRPGGDPHGRR